MRDAFGRGVGAVRGRECVVDIDVAELGERSDEGRIVLFFLLVEAGVLEQQHVAVLHRRDRGLRYGADAIGGEPDRPAESSATRRGDRPQRIGRVGPALGAAEMGEQNDLAALVGDLADRRQHALDARCVADFAVFHGNVEVDAQQDAFALDVGGVEGAEWSGHGCVSLDEAKTMPAASRPGCQSNDESAGTSAA